MREAKTRNTSGLAGQARAENVKFRISVGWPFPHVRYFTGVLEESYVREVLDGDYFSNITEEMNTTWKKLRGKSVKESLNEYLVENVGKPMSQLLR